MNQEHVVLSAKPNRAPLAGTFEQVFQRVAASPGSESGRILSAFVVSLVDGDEFNLALIEHLPVEVDRLLCLALFVFCMADGLTEDERSEISAAFAPFNQIHQPGTRH